MPGCVFCTILAGLEPAGIVRVWADAVALVPVRPVADGHVIVIPRAHVPHALADPDAAGLTARRAAEYAADARLAAANLITSAGAAATQTVYHLHVHVVPRAEGDGLALPWSAPGRLPLPHSAGRL